MPSCIPYDPDLALTSVVTEAALNTLEAIAAAQAPVTTAQDVLNALLSTKRSLEKTRTELRNLGIDAAPINAEIAKLDVSIGDAAAAVAKAKMAAEPTTQALRSKIRTLNAGIESPVDSLRSEVKTMPLAADSMDMNVQYFSYDSSSQTTASFASQFASYVSSGASGILGPGTSSKLAAAASAQVSRQLLHHSIEGTLVLTVSSTHKNATVLAPFVVHADKGIKVWNHLFPHDKLDPTSRESMTKAARNESTEKKQKYSIISGMTYGSSFVGMVHALKSADTSSASTMTSLAETLQAAIDVGDWDARARGKMSVDSKFVSEFKNLLGQQSITSHISLMCVGAIPQNIAKDAKITIHGFTRADSPSNAEQLSSSLDATDGEQSRIAAAAERSRTGEQSTEADNKTRKAASYEMAENDTMQDKTLDVNSMMDALNSYVEKASTGDAGVPINYYLKDIDRKMLAEMWVAKYYPGEYMAIKYDDSEGAGPAIDGKDKTET